MTLFQFLPGHARLCAASAGCLLKIRTAELLSAGADVHSVEGVFRIILQRGAGPLAAFFYSGANFFLAFMLQSHVSDVDFGLYAFSIVLMHFGLSISNAIFASPIVLWMERKTVEKDEVVQSFFLANVLYVTFSSVVFCSFLLGLGAPGSLIGVAVAQAAALWMRWFFRAVELANHDFARSALGDGAYAAVTLLSGVLLFELQGVDPLCAFAAMLLGTMTSIAVVGWKTILLLNTRRPGSLHVFARSFSKHGGWATLGVATTEITANLHSYVLTLWLGPASLAPVAILSLFLRPLPILMQTLTQYERPVMARMIGNRSFGQLRKRVRMVAMLVISAVALNSLGLAVVIATDAGLIGDGQYDAVELWPLFALLAAGQFVRGLRTGSSAAAQGAGLFRPLAMATIVAAPATLIGTVVAILADWHVVPMVLAAVLAGEVVAAILIRRTYVRLIGRRGI